MNNNLKKTYEITKILNDINIPDSYATAKEIIEHTQDDAYIEEIITRLKNNEPWEYIRGYIIYRNNKIFVDDSTIIPRIETERIVELVKGYSKVSQIIEVGAGTGAITISIAKELEYTPLFYALEYYDNTINLLYKNIKESKLEKKIKVIKSDLLDNYEDINNNIDSIIIANLPYISEKEYLELQPSVKDYEPKTALVGGINGYELMYKLLDQIIEFKFNTKVIILEGSESINNSVLEYAKKLFLNFDISIIKDIYNRDRFILIQQV